MNKCVEPKCEIPGWCLQKVILIEKHSDPNLTSQKTEMDTGGDNSY